jgi:hypothetical protein
MNASLIMRDRETDSWWSIMTSDAIGGELNGADLVELPRGEKMTWKDWRERHPDTLVLSVGGEEHVENNPYQNYFSSDGTFRNLEIEDKRLAPKDSIYSFWLNDEPYAVPHRSYEGGKLFKVKGLDGQRLFLYRSPGSSIFEGSRAYLVDEQVASANSQTDKLLAMAGDEDDNGIAVLPGFDTFWYSWISVNEKTHLIK